MIAATNVGRFADVAVPVALAGVALVDGGFAGFRAATGRNARIAKRRYDLQAAARGLAAGAVSLLVAAAVLVAGLLGAPDSGDRYTSLVQAGGRMLVVLLPFAALVAISLAAYWLLPMRWSTFVILVGLGPFTLLRPLVVSASAVFAVVGARGPLAWVGTLLAATGVLLVEPLVHRRWYGRPR